MFVNPNCKQCRGVGIIRFYEGHRLALKLINTVRCPTCKNEEHELEYLNDMNKMIKKYKRGTYCVASKKDINTIANLGIALCL